MKGRASGYRSFVPVSESSELDVLETRKRVLVAAREEIVTRGILGMRVARVAARAGCSVTAMYRQFGSRDGILAEVLMVLYEESFEEQYSVIREKLGGTGPLTIDDVIASIPMPHSPNSRKTHALRSQVMSVAGTNPILRAKLAESIQAKRKMLTTVIDDVELRLPAGTKFNRELITVMVFNMHWQYNDLMGEAATTNSEYESLLRRLLNS